MKIQLDRSYTLEECKALCNNSCPVCNKSNNLYFYEGPYTELVQIYCGLGHFYLNTYRDRSTQNRDRLRYRWDSCNFNDGGLSEIGRIRFTGNKLSLSIDIYWTLLLDNNFSTVDLKILYQKYMILKMVS